MAGHILTSSSHQFRKTIEDLLAPADVHINGDRLWDLHVRNDAFYSRLLSEGAIAAGETYMDGWWDCHRLDELFARILRCNFDKALKHWSILNLLAARIMNLQTIQRAFMVGHQHYDIGNDLYQAMLDSRMLYSCAYWQNAMDLDAAQTAKLSLIASKLHLESGMRI